MPDWSSSAERNQDAVAQMKLVHAILGLYAWEFTLSLGFDWAVLTGRTRFRWPLVFYFAARYILLFALIGTIIALDTTKEMNCQALYTFNQLVGDATAGLPSINLSIRTIAIWSRNKWIVALLVMVTFGHWSLILQGALLTAAYIPGEGCTIIKENNTILAATFIYTMCFDLLVLVLSAFKLAWQRHSRGMGFQSRLVKMVFVDGLVYFFIAFIANTIAVVFMLLDLNSIMSIFFNCTATTTSTVVACRVVRRLYDFDFGPKVL
ncbi:hypothetical protein CONPUDRAFT_61074 [Coniophora puteana RWD-64-598 SS2]|uniref:G-protein coupled receptors family 1 profile domain-containing protein n=1 Tax=Coniophora puteana (strain RWD-64-598) TaxID=741705 RepID=A0A5M3MHI5_CONPW|nr:uncharacterized protein CONPUDRAFT_61074 [Coniophora puteana RWD-64-598 SS2]EIW78517.1 hypothetical protein CONPUDRAFT_61074 [Coniophora puteana RWD-64-598 SS2]